TPRMTIAARNRSASGRKPSARPAADRAGKVGSGGPEAEPDDALGAALASNGRIGCRALSLGFIAGRAPSNSAFPPSPEPRGGRAPASSMGSVPTRERDGTSSRAPALVFHGALASPRSLALF